MITKEDARALAVAYSALNGELSRPEGQRCPADIRFWTRLLDEAQRNTGVELFEQDTIDGLRVAYQPKEEVVSG